MNKDRIAKESEDFAHKLVKFCEAAYPDGGNESAHILMNAFIYASCTLGVSVGFSPESVIQGFITGVQEAYNSSGKYKVEAGIVKTNSDLAKAAQAVKDRKWDANEYSNGPLFDTGRPKYKHEVN